MTSLWSLFGISFQSKPKTQALNVVIQFYRQLTWSFTTLLSYWTSNDKLGPKTGHLFLVSPLPITVDPSVIINPCLSKCQNRCQTGESWCLPSPCLYLSTKQGWQRTRYKCSIPHPVSSLSLHEFPQQCSLCPYGSQPHPLAPPQLRRWRSQLLHSTYRTEARSWVINNSTMQLTYWALWTTLPPFLPIWDIPFSS